MAAPARPAVRARRGGGAAVVAEHLYLVGGIAGPPGSLRPRPAVGLVLDLADPTRWRFAPGAAGARAPSGVTAAGGRIYAVGGRTAGYDTNTRLVESWRPGERAWAGREAPVPRAAGPGRPQGRAACSSPSAARPRPARSPRVYAYDLRRGRWHPLADLPTPRHGLGVAAVGPAASTRSAAAPGRASP